MEANYRYIQDTTANPAPLGLLGFGMTTVLLNFFNASNHGLDSMVLAMGIFYGGIAQIIAGVMEWKKGNTFGTTAFISYGSFWLTLVGLIVMPKLGWIGAAGPQRMALYLAMWGIFTGFMFIGTLKLSNSLKFIFGSLTILFFLLAIADYLKSPGLKMIAGYEGIICGFSAIYTGVGQIINETHKKTVFPL
jgi:succinate-acetate transporter protein